MSIRINSNQPHFSLPFAYSRNNMDIKNLNNGPLYDKTTKCAEIKDCGGTCMKQTFLEVSWSQCLGYVYAHTHLSKMTICF